MPRPRLLVPVGVAAVLAAAGGVVAATSVADDDRPDAPDVAAGDVRDAAADLRPIAGDDGLTYAQARKARAAALKRVPGRAVQIDRDDDGRTRFDVQVITRGGAVREVDLDRRYRIIRVGREDADGLTYATAGRAAAAATRHVRGIVTDIEREDEGRARYEVEVLTPGSRERTVRLSSSYGVVTGSSGDDD
jgi:uncharacterized membrane protein YkoI